MKKKYEYKTVNLVDGFLEEMMAASEESLEVMKSKEGINENINKLAEVMEERLNERDLLV